MAGIRFVSCVSSFYLELPGSINANNIRVNEQIDTFIVIPRDLIIIVAVLATIYMLRWLNGVRSFFHLHSIFL